MNSTDRFAAEVRRFRKWLYCGTDKKERAVREALRHVTRVVTAAVDLPPVCWDKLHAETAVDLNRSLRLTSRKPRLHPINRMPFNYYRKVFNPFEEPPEEPVFASLNDDLWDLDGDLSRGLVEYNAGNRVLAAWRWESGFRGHWGRHATGAIEALRSWLELHSKD